MPRSRLALLLSTFLALAPGYAAAAAPGGIDVCHRGSRIRLPVQAANALLAHGATLPSVWYRDADADGFGSAAGATTACAVADGYVSDPTDCDDADPAVHPDALESCDGYDDDCDGMVDESGALGERFWFADADADGFGDVAATVAACTQPAGTVADDTDCDDADAGVNPAADEACGDGDEDCDGLVDESGAIGVSSWYLDSDADGYGDPEDLTLACDAPADHVGVAADCDDSEPTVNPAATEVCDARDDDCDGEVDEDAVDAPPWYVDLDGDGYGDGASAILGCSAPDAFVADNSDCDDGDANVNTSGEEVCDGIDDDCDGEVDEPTATDAGAWFPDLDADGFGDGASPALACDQPEGFLADGSDCDDGDFGVNPDAVETCDDVDDDCDGSIDDPSSADATAWYADADGDGYGDWFQVVVRCDAPGGYVTDSTDCADDAASVNPGAPAEICGNGYDDDCDGSMGSCGITGTLPLTAAMATFALQPGVGSDVSFAGAAVGDFTGDGVSDVVAGVYSAGVVQVFDGPNTGAVPWSSGFQIGGEVPSPLLGLDLAGGDVDADGVDDLIVADPGSSGSGRVYLFHGPVAAGNTVVDADLTITGDRSGDYLGMLDSPYGSLSLRADDDQDGVLDALISGWTVDRVRPDGATVHDTGAVYLFSGDRTGSVRAADADARIYGPIANGYAGRTAVLGDVDGDGYGDYAIAAPETGTGLVGVVYLVHGPLSPGAQTLDAFVDRIVGAPSELYCGYSLGAPGDVDGDDVPDLVVGCNGRSAWLFPGNTRGVQYTTVDDAAVALTMDSPTSYVGYGVSSEVDLDENGATDLVIGVGLGAAVLYGPLHESSYALPSQADAFLVTNLYGTQLRTGDIDDDGDTDVLLGTQSSGPRFHQLAAFGGGSY